MIRLTPPTRERYGSSGWAASRVSGLHRGIDFPTDEGAPVFAAADGVVVHVKNSDTGRAGLMVIIHHGGGIHTRYLHNSRNLVVKGQRVRRGEVIARAGSTGTTAPHVHFDTRMQDAALGEYARRYGVPDPGFGREFTSGRAVPSETFMDNVKYKPSVVRSSLERGVVFYKPSGLFTLALVVGAAYVAYRVLK